MVRIIMTTQRLQQKKEVTVGFFGEVGSGKTQLVNVLIGDGFKGSSVGIRVRSTIRY
ncbi:hypothetical protein Lche_2336 [Legionella cherrii]|uniref:Uncharacterized protein n=1 Tax=Legionella cherrii TaxID=28084 RepID=A0A0W0S9P1_9GAMM|nr:hypothetical protein Lche_2336 [Legionella cherrii]